MSALDACAQNIITLYHTIRTAALIYYYYFRLRFIREKRLLKYAAPSNANSTAVSPARRRMYDLTPFPRRIKGTSFAIHVRTHSDLCDRFPLQGALYYYAQGFRAGERCTWKNRPPPWTVVVKSRCDETTWYRVFLEGKSSTRENRKIKTKKTFHRNRRHAV